MATALRVQDDMGLLGVTLQLEDAALDHAAIDVVFNLLGHEQPDVLVGQGVLPASDLEALRGLQRLIFDRDDEGLFIRDGVAFETNGQEVDPDAPLATYCALGACRWVVKAPRPESAPAPTMHEQLARYAHMMLLHQTAVGHGLDVTKDFPELAGAIAEAEKLGQLEIDIPTATYKLTPIGKRTHQTWMDEAQELIKRFDVFGDVLLDSTGSASFDTGMGEDMRVPMFELAGIDPFRARFLLGLNDGEWDGMPHWWSQVTEPEFFTEVFSPIEAAPSVDDMGRAKLERIREQAGTYLKSQGARI
jgi:hypothetical protein